MPRALKGRMLRLLVVAGCAIATTAASAGPTAEFDPATGEVTVRNGRLELVVATRSGINPRGMRDLESDRVYADADYSWPNGAFPTLVGSPTIVRKDGECSVAFRGTLGELDVVQTFVAPAGQPDVLTETVTIRNPGTSALDTSAFAGGFRKRAHDGKDWRADVATRRLCDVPYRRHPETGELCDNTVPELAARKSWFSTTRDPMHGRRESPIHGAEGWAWYGDGNALLISKYNPDALEWSLLDMASPGANDAERCLRFGGAGRWKLGDPEGAASLAPGAAFAFGTTRYEALDGDWRAAYAAFRRAMDARGHRAPKGFDPPVHWNELYDNPLWWGTDNAENRKRYYQRKDMKVEADKAEELGCGCLYLDPGWDTVFASTIWADDRLGTQPSFVAWLMQDYGMSLALHTPLAPWTDPTGYPVETRRMDKSGKRLDELCCASSLYIKTKVARLKKLCRDGAYFLMYDGSWFPGECWDPSHGHSLPVTHQEHLDAILKIAQGVHAQYPNVLIEQHDPMTGPGTVRYTPTYFMHAKPGAFDELWGYEYMVEPMDDILSRRAYSLYYANLAYDIPIYLHIDLRKDNAEAMMFWWYASTCRHLGVGGKHPDPAVWAAHKNAMKTYLGLKRFFAEGEFFGLDETVHVHTLADRGACVINCFNPETTAIHKDVRVRPAEIGLPSIATDSLRVTGAASTVQSGQVVVHVEIPARGHVLLRVETAKQDSPAPQG